MQNDPRKNNFFIINVTGTLNHPISKSQILNWIFILETHEIETDIVSCVPIPGLIKGRNAELSIIKDFKNKFRGNIYRLPIVRSKDKNNPISRWIKIAFLTQLIKRKLKNDKFDTIVLQTRSHFNYYPLKVLKRRFPQVKVLYDMRGAGAAEYLNSKGYTNKHEIKENEVKKEYLRLLKRESGMVKMAEVTLCVSNKLKQELGSGDYQVNTNKVHVVPGAADENIFYYDLSVRDRKRKDLGIEGKFAIIYSGGLKNFYQKKELVFEFASKLLATNTSLYFICLTKDLSMIPVMLEKFPIDEHQMCVHYAKDHQEVNEFLNAADMGLIFRDDIITNRVSSPTKAAEYLLAGLPVMISENVGDYSDFIDSNYLGLVVNNNIDEMLNQFDKRDGIVPRDEISQISKFVYSKQANINNVIDIFKNNFL